MDLIKIYLIEHRLKFRFSEVPKYFNFNLFDQSYTFAPIYQYFIFKKNGGNMIEIDDKFLRGFDE